MDAPTILTGCGIALIALAVGYSICWFNEVNWRDQKITRLELDQDEDNHRIDKLVGILKGVRADLAKRDTELSALRATAIIRDAKGHFIKAKA